MARRRGDETRAAVLAPANAITIAGVELVVDALYAGVFELPGDDSVPDNG